MPARAMSIAAALFSLAAAMTSPALAAPSSSSFEVSPTTLDLVPGEPGLFYVANRGDAPVAIQIQTMDWHQQGNADSLLPSETFYASPPLVQVAPGKRQTVRLLAVPQDGAGEHDYRLIVSEMPQDGTSRTAVHVLLQFSIPVFVSANPASRPAIAWTARNDAGALEISARNDGPAALKLTDIRISSANSSSVPVTAGLAYVLPGAMRSWRVAMDAQASVHIVAREERSGDALSEDVVPQR